MTSMTTRTDTVSQTDTVTPYQSTTVVEALSHVNTDWYIPAFQRDFEWRADRIIRLFDSVLRGFPINSFLLWRIESRYRKKWPLYEFIREYKENMTKSGKATTPGVKQLTFVLDGQQRLTSFLIGLRGAYLVRPRLYSWYNKDANWKRQHLYLNLLQDPDTTVDDTGDKAVYGLAFFPEDAVPESTSVRHWVRVGIALDLNAEPDLDAAISIELAELPPTVHPARREIAERNIRRLYNVICLDPVISYYTETRQKYDIALTVFLRTNHAGKPLTKSNLMRSIITASWEHIDAREDIQFVVESLNQKLPKFSVDFVMKASLFLADLPVGYKVDNFTNAHIERIRQTWPDIKRSLDAVVTLATSFNLDGASLIGTNPLIPIAYYIFHHPGANLFGTGDGAERTTRRIRFWLLSALINGTFSNQSDTALASARNILRDQSPLELDFPLEILNERIAGLDRNMDITRMLVNKLMGSSPSYLLWFLLYDDKMWQSMPVQVDHIFSKKFINVNTQPDRIQHYMLLRERIGNLQLLNARENEQKKAQPLDDWIEKRTEDFKQRQFIPEDQSLYILDNFEQFIDERERLIRDRLTKMLSPVR